MNDTASPARVLIWDAPQRLAHALLIVCLAGAWLTAERDGARLWHLSFGLCAAGLVVWRLLWGWVGSRHARFADFVRGPGAVVAHLRGLLDGRPEPHAGHNPAGGWAVLALLAFGLLVPASGWLMLQGGERFEDLHEALAQGWLVLVGVHVAAVLLTGWRLRQNLVRAMVDGRKPAPAADALRSIRPLMAAVLLAGVLGFWAWQLVQAPKNQAIGQPLVQARATAEHGGENDDD